MILFTTIFLLFAILIIRKNIYHRSTQFFIGIILGWIISLLFLLIYLSKHNYYYNIVDKIFNIGPDTWKNLIYINISKDIAMRLFNSGLALFIYSFFCFAIAYTNTGKKYSLKNSKIYLLLFILPFIQIIYYDHGVFKVVYTFLEKIFNYQISLMKNIDFFAYYLFKLIDIGYLSAGLYLLIKYYYNYPKVRFIKRYTLYNILGLLPIVIIYILLFSWAPRRLVKPTLIEGYFNYIVPDLNQFIKFYNFFPYIVFVLFLFLVFLIYRYNSIETYYSSMDIHIKRSINTAQMGLRAFTHSIKNHLLAIRSEAEFLKERHRDDEETRYSLQLILNSCSQSFSSIDHAVQKLNNFTLDLHPCHLDIPIKKAIAKINLPHNILLDLNYCQEIPLAYIDEEHITETIYNIIDNARDAIDTNQQGLITLSLEIQENWAIISITDNGAGIADDCLEKIFEPFNSTKSSLNNWGIGLSYCHKIINAHDGEIIVESKEGQGTTFKILLPSLS